MCVIFSHNMVAMRRASEIQVVEENKRFLEENGNNDQKLLATRLGKELLDLSPEQREIKFKDYLAHLNTAFKPNIPVSMAIFMSAGVNPIRKMLHVDQSLLHWVMDLGILELTKNVLRHANCDSICENESHRLFYANDIQLAELLVQYGANVQVKNEKDENLVMYHAHSSSKDSISLMKYYVQQGVNPLAISNEGNTVLHRMVRVCGHSYKSDQEAIELNKMKLLLALWIPIQRRNKQNETVEDILNEKLGCFTCRFHRTKEEIDCGKCCKSLHILNMLKLIKEEQKRRNEICGNWIKFVKANRLANQRNNGELIAADIGLPVPLPGEIMIIIVGHIVPSYILKKVSEDIKK